MKIRTRIADALTCESPQDQIFIKGWVRTRRDAKGFSFFEVNDGSCLKNIQVIADHSILEEDTLKDIATGAAITVEGALVPSPGKGQKWEIQARDIGILGSADQAVYPLQKKRHSDEFLRTIAHLRPRTNKYGAMFRMRSQLAHAVHAYFRDRGFYYIQTPLLTGSDCEGAGEMFRVTALPAGEWGHIAGADQGKSDFFGKEAYLTVSGQLAAEAFACSLGSVYTFGPTFRAESSDTPRHAAEFWMVEPEMAFADLQEDMDVAEDLLRHLVSYIMMHCQDDLELFARFVDKNLMTDLETVASQPFIRLPYIEALEILRSSGRKFEYPTEYGCDLQTEHERYLCEEHFKQPVIVFDYPKEIKAFYMRLNDDGKTVAAMDVLVPRIGEIIGGSQREERLDVLQSRLADQGLDMECYDWYLDLRRFGSVPHAGFGLGFERLLMLVTGVRNIRDVIAFPRTYKHLEY
ncbi:asparagine--tRNA ligase [Desulfovibrio inopinatus]|uniref:asparagine--tRNA ligase n=1 Tax=Desulfovibrio inopinatus TaxID=102109 RepID=UPI00041ABF3F|nr:asparagine--tRNA ligase [Desulfovibrio inopinatus]